MIKPPFSQKGSYKISPFIPKSVTARFWKIDLLSRLLGKQDKYGPKAEYLAS